MAERVARRLGDERADAGAAGDASAGGDLSDLRASLSEIQRRLARGAEDQLRIAAPQPGRGRRAGTHPLVISGKTKSKRPPVTRAASYF